MWEHRGEVVQLLRLLLQMTYVHYFDKQDQDLNDLQHWPDSWTDENISDQHLLHRRGYLSGMQYCQTYPKDKIDHHQLR